MQTASINVSTLCVPCANRCRYCLLSYDGHLPGADYDRSQRYAERFWQWLKENRPELGFQFYYGYSMEHPRLTDAIDFARKIGSAGGEFLQFDGLRFRNEEETEALLRGIIAHGIRMIDLTFYGTRAYHDRFAARQGDFDYLLSILGAANRLGLEVNVSVPITNENAAQMTELLDLFSAYRTQRVMIFVPNGAGRGAALESIRLTRPTLDSLPEQVRAHINLNRFKPEGWWVGEGNFSTPEKRMLGLTLTRENIDCFERLDFAETSARLEQLDDAYYAAVPPLPELARRYGDPAGEGLFSERDLYLYYQRKFIAETGLNIYDVNDERNCFSRRY